MPKPKNNRKKKKLNKNNHKNIQQVNEVEPSPNSHLLAKVINQGNAKNLVFFTQQLLSDMTVSMHVEEQEWYDSYDEIISNDWDFLIFLLLATYYKKESKSFFKYFTQAVLGLSAKVYVNCSNEFKYEVIHIYHPNKQLESVSHSQLELLIQAYTADKLLTILDFVKARYTSVFLELVHKRIELRRKVAEF